MTRQTFLNLLLLAFLVSLCPRSFHLVSAASAVSEEPGNKPVVAAATPPSAPKIPGTDFSGGSLHAKGHKMHLQKIEELGKIHRFHKERVKKVRKHQGEYWLAALLLVVSCHLALLIHAFMHLTH